MPGAKEGGPMVRADAAMKPLITVLLAVACAFAQPSDRVPTTSVG